MADQWFSFFPGDYLRDTRGLSLAEHGAYFLLLSELYVRNGEPLPANAKQLHTICSAFAKAEKAAVDTVIRRYFEKVDGGYIQGRAMEEIARRQEISKKRAVAGSKSRASVKQLQPANAKQLHTPPPPQEEDSSLRSESSLLDLGLPPEDSSGNSVTKLRVRAPDLVWDATLEVCGLAGAEPTPTERGRWNKAVKDLKAAGATPQEIRARAQAYRRRWPKIDLTPMALASNWNQCVAEKTG